MYIDCVLRFDLGLWVYTKKIQNLNLMTGVSCFHFYQSFVSKSKIKTAVRTS